MPTFRWLITLTLALLAGSASTLAAADEPIRLGFLTINSGALAAGGKQMEDGLKLFLKERNNMIAGRKVELFVGDTAGVPAVTKTKTQELVERNKMHVIIGPLAAFEALAIDDYIRSSADCRPSRVGRRRGPDAAQAQSRGSCAHVALRRSPPPAGRLLRQDAEVQAHGDRRRRLRLRPRDVAPASSACSRKRAARSCRSCSRR